MLQIAKNRIVCWGLGFLGMIALYQTLAVPTEEMKTYVAGTNSFLSAWVCILSAILYEKVCKRAEGKKTWQYLVACFYSITLAFALTAGKYLETVENLNVAEVKIWLNILGLTLYFVPFVVTIWAWIEQIWKLQENRNVSTKATAKTFLAYWGIIFLCWIPVFLAFYPGAFVYDAYDEYIQVATNTYTTHHPLAHVLLLGKFVSSGYNIWGNYNTGIALYTVFQMLLLSAVFSYTICYIKAKTKNRHIVIGVILFYGLFPVIPMYAVCSSKDTIFTAAFLVVIIKMLQLWEDTEQFLNNRGNVFVSILASVVMMLFRNNGMYAYIVWIPVVVGSCILLKRDKKNICKITILMLVSFLIYQGTSKMLTVYTNADDSESQEIMTVPIQQMVRTYVYSPETYTLEEKKILFEILPEEDMHLYNARLSDLIKSKFDNQTFNQNKEKYLRLWAKIGLRKPMIYLNAWLMTSYGYWYPDAVINVYGGNGVYTFTYGDSSYFGFETETPGIRESKFPWLEEQYRKISLELYQQKIPGISMLFSPGFMFWVFMLCVCYFVQAQRWDKVISFTGILLLWGTAILGPTYLVRYVLILWFAMPVVMAETKS